jgi:expansin (peptidoglycan-binding protein)
MLTYSRISKALGVLFAIAVLTTGACGSKSESSDAGCQAGGESCSCLSNGGCDDGLTCATNLNRCVRLAGTSTGGTTGSGGDGAGGTGTGGNGAGGTGSGGTAGSGGTTGTGGTSATGGTKGTGGTSGSAGTKGTGGTTGTGGTMSTGGSTGTGGTSGGPCTWSSGPNSNSGEITCYNFGQGTAKGGGCSSYKTYCGYCGTESGNGGGTCPSGITDTVSNIGTNYFAAFPVGTFGQGKYCGMCVDVTWMGKSITATIVDECATCPTAGHIDLSETAAAALGLGQGSNVGDATSGVTWKAVDCPVTGNIVAVFNNGSSGQVYFQNVVFPVAQAVAGGHSASQAYGYWDFGASVGGQSVTLTDTVGHVVTGTIPGSSGGSVGAQFPMTCQ